MKLLEECYSEILLNEALRDINSELTTEKVENDLKNKYDEYRDILSTEIYGGHKLYFDKTGKDEVPAIQKTMLEIIRKDDSYTAACYAVEKNKASIAIFAGLDKSWNNYFRANLSIEILAPAKLLIFDYLAEMGLNIKVAFTPTKQPIYPFHLITYFLQTEIFKELLNDKKISEPTFRLLKKSLNKRFEKYGIETELEKFTLFPGETVEHLRNLNNLRKVGKKEPTLSTHDHYMPPYV